MGWSRCTNRGFRPRMLEPLADRKGEGIFLMRRFRGLDARRFAGILGTALVLFLVLLTVDIVEARGGRRGGKGKGKSNLQFAQVTSHIHSYTHLNIIHTLFSRYHGLSTYAL